MWLDWVLLQLVDSLGKHLQQAKLLDQHTSPGLFQVVGLCNFRDWQRRFNLKHEICLKILYFHSRLVESLITAAFLKPPVAQHQQYRALGNAEVSHHMIDDQGMHMCSCTNSIASLVTRSCYQHMQKNFKSITIGVRPTIGKSSSSHGSVLHNMILILGSIFEYGLDRGVGKYNFRPEVQDLQTQAHPFIGLTFKLECFFHWSMNSCSCLYVWGQNSEALFSECGQLCSPTWALISSSLWGLEHIGHNTKPAGRGCADPFSGIFGLTFGGAELEGCKPPFCRPFLPCWFVLGFLVIVDLPRIPCSVVWPRKRLDIVYLTWQN